MSKQYMLPTPSWSLSADELAKYRSRLNAINRELKRADVPQGRLSGLRQEAYKLDTKIRLAEQSGCGCGDKATVRNADARPVMATFSGGYITGGGKPAAKQVVKRTFAAVKPYWQQ